MYNKLLKLVTEIIEIDKSDAILVESLFETIDCSKGEILEVENKVAKYLYFINSGFIRVYYNQNGEFSLLMS